MRRRWDRTFGERCFNLVPGAFSRCGVGIPIGGISGERESAMDPNIAWARIQELMSSAEAEDADLLGELYALALDLDGWLKSNGFPPDDSDPDYLAGVLTGIKAMGAHALGGEL